VTNKGRFVNKTHANKRLKSRRAAGGRPQQARPAPLCPDDVPPGAEYFSFFLHIGLEK